MPSESIHTVPQKLDMNLKALPRLGVRMDEDTRELIDQLCTRIGMIMEDMSVVALSIPAMRGHERQNAVSKINATAAQITALAQAAKVLQV